MGCHVGFRLDSCGHSVRVKQGANGMPSKIRVGFCYAFQSDYIGHPLGFDLDLGRIISYAKWVPRGPQG